MHTIAGLTVAGSGLGSLTIDAITSRARAFHDPSGFHATTATTVGGISFTPPAGPAQTFPAPTPDQPVEIPGLATIYVGRTGPARARTGPWPTPSRCGSTWSRPGPRSGSPTPTPTSTGAAYGVFGGHSAATRVVEAADALAHSGPNPLSVMPCQGTYGTTHRQALAHLDLGGQLVVRGLASQQQASQTPARRTATSGARSPG